VSGKTALFASALAPTVALPALAAGAAGMNPMAKMPKPEKVDDRALKRDIQARNKKLKNDLALRNRARTGGQSEFMSQGSMIDLRQTLGV
jgi:hypothetical protein